MKKYKKIDNFEPIAMKCTQDQFNKIKPMLDKFKIHDETFDFANYPYLVNNSDGEKLKIANYFSYEKNNYSRKVHEIFNAKTFLKACGIAEKTKLNKLTNKEIVHAFENPQWLKDTFPKAFESKLEVGKWYKHKKLKYIFCYNGKRGNATQYGFNYKGEFINYIGCDEIQDKYLIQLTPQEIETALKNEAVKRYKSKDYVKCFEHKIINLIDLGFKPTLENNNLYYGGSMVFKDGIWAEIVPTKTKEEAEKLLNCKIV